MTRSARPSCGSSRPRRAPPRGRPRGRSGARRAPAWALVLLAAWPAPAFARPAGAQEVEDLAGSWEKYRGVLTLANQKLEDLELPEALAAFSEVVDAYQTGRLSASSPPARQIVGQAFEGRARTYANLGRDAEAESDFASLVRFDLTWPLDRTRTSPKILAIHDKVRARLVGTLAIRTEPPGALLALDGRPAGRTPLFDHEILAGTYAMAVEAPGFESLTETVKVDGGGRLEKLLTLVPNARGVLVATTPAGARVSVDGKERGATFGEAGPEYAEAAAAAGIPLAQVSAPLLLEHVAPGAHLLRVEKECHEPLSVAIEVSVDPSGNPPLRIEPLRLTPSLGGLAVESIPSGAEVLVDGKPAGRTPARLGEQCSGAHRVLLRRSGVGQWIGEVQVARGQVAMVKQALRMTVAYVGMTVAGTAGEAPAGERDLGEALAALTSFNVLRPGDGLPEDLRARAGGVSGAGLETGFVSRVAAETGADLVIAAKPAEGGFGRKLEVLIHAARYPVSDRVGLSLDEEDAVDRLLERLDEKPVLAGAWLGLSTIDTHRSRNPIIVRAQPGGPAAAAGAMPGESVISLGGRAVERAADLDKAVAGMAPGTRASLTLQQPGRQPRVVNVTIGATPVMPAPRDPARLGSVLAANLSFRARLEEALDRSGGQDHTSALLGLGVLLMGEGQCQAALTGAFEVVSPPRGAGISAGTASYLRALCLKRLGRAEEARRWLQEAASQPDATLGTNGGPPVAERAARLLEGAAGL